MKQAKDIMTKDVICITKSTSIYDAIKLMTENQITGIPVVDNDMTLIGILTEQDVLSLYYKNEEDKTTAVEKFLTEPVIHFEENESVFDICNCLKDHTIRRVPITSKGKVVGIVSKSDILLCILKQWKESSISIS